MRAIAERVAGSGGHAGGGPRELTGHRGGWCSFLGAQILLLLALAQGFVGLVAYVAAWVFLLPFMLIASAAVGGFVWWVGGIDAREERAEARREKAETRKRRRHPPAAEKTLTSKRPIAGPSDPKERYLWANRLPPYDQDDA